MYSQAESPLNSFRASHWNPLASSQMDQMSDYNNTPSDTISSPTVTVASSKEACLSDTNTPESTPLYSSTGENLQTTVEQGFSQLQLGGSHSFSSKSLPPVGSHALSRNVSDSRIHATTLGSNRNAMSEARHSFRWSDRGGELSGNTSDWWSMRTFSELVASSRRERPRWVNASSPSDFGFVPERVSTDRAESVMERIRASGPPSASMSPQSEVLTCGLCSRWLSQRSPLSPHKLIANNDLAVVGVLSCGHVFHAECLEQATPKEGAHDPPCPQCHALETLSSRRCSLESVASKSVMKSSFQGQSSSRNKLSRIGIMTDDISVEISSDASHANIKNSSCSQGTGDKVVSQMSSLMEKSSLSRSLSRTFSFRGKGMKDSISSDLNLKKKGLPYPTSPDNHPREDQSKATHLRRAFKHLQVPRRGEATGFHIHSRDGHGSMSMIGCEYK
ncbi:hypothetical protein O6H91_01G004200 [Diphasiastrum complanatum]|uniref:Uncharacterized protein n=1 Tax=Diphasiastrum complanatum TaxID=34168 RepID=A0ACC2EMW9_DIPCM|nr:hypothetical protein O6H91_01G004200 [Diphasiastrum complanatum]